MGRTACTEPQCLCKGVLYLYLTYVIKVEDTSQYRILMYLSFTLRLFRFLVRNVDRYRVAKRNVRLDKTPTEFNICGSEHHASQ